MQTSKGTYSQVEPIYVNWMVENNGDNALPLTNIQISAKQHKPRMLYVLQLRSVSNNAVNAPTDAFMSGDIASVYAHSTKALKTFDLRAMFASDLAKGGPGLYRITIAGSWILGEASSAYQKFTFSSDAYFYVE
jgi:hypothetical protein